MLPCVGQLIRQAFDIVIGRCQPWSMSSRTDPSLGTLAERMARTNSLAPRTPWCVVDGELPGVVARWTNLGGRWEALVAWVQDGEVRIGTLPAERLSPR